MPHESTMMAVAYRPCNRTAEPRRAGFDKGRFHTELRGSKEPVVEIGYCDMCEAEGIQSDGWGWVEKTRATWVLCDAHRKQAQRRGALKLARMCIVED